MHIYLDLGIHIMCVRNCDCCLQELNLFKLLSFKIVFSHFNFFIKKIRYDFRKREKYQWRMFPICPQAKQFCSLPKRRTKLLLAIVDIVL